MMMDEMIIMMVMVHDNIDEIYDKITKKHTNIMTFE